MTEKEGEQRGKRLRRVREEGGSGNGGVTEYYKGGVREQGSREERKM